MTLKEAAAEILAIVERGSYVSSEGQVDFLADQNAAVAGTRLYSPDQLETLRSQAAEGDNPRINVVDGTTQVVAHSVAQASSNESGSIALLNFASARNPGGGFLNGAKAQEEDLCRCSGLYPCLLQCMEYYETNRRHDSLLYTDYAIFSPDVPFFKTRGTGDFLPAPFLVSVITAPAPNTGPFLRSNPGQTDALEQAFARRWENVLCIARDRRITRCLLGAWGCGAFGGDPAMAARTAKLAIDKFGKAFAEIVFAIPGKGRQSKGNLNAFRQAFSA